MHGKGLHANDSQKHETVDYEYQTNIQIQQRKNTYKNNNWFFCNDKNRGSEGDMNNSIDKNSVETKTKNDKTDTIGKQ